MKMSAASLRATQYPKDNQEWFCNFAYTEIKGLGPEVGIHRRDPSSILNIDGTYYVWYTKSTGKCFSNSKFDDYTKKFPWDYADIWYATSTDGITWNEQTCAVHRGSAGEYDERTVCTPDVLKYKNKYYLVYQCKAQGTYLGSGESVAMAVADNPDGPWKKTSTNILERMEEGHWFKADGSYNDQEFEGRVHDPSLFYYNDKFYLYYKCGINKQRTHKKFAGNDTRWGVAIADKIEGPYHHSEYNPITNSGHETMLWHYKGGICALINRDGPEKDTIQYAKDGINFEIMSHVNYTPWAGGAYRGNDNDRTPLEGVRWGLCHHDEGTSRWNYITRFDINTF